MDTEEILRSFGANVRQSRKQANMTQEDLAEAIGRSVDTVSNIERGAASTRIGTAALIAETLKTNLSELFERPSLSEQNRAKREELEKLLGIARKVDTKTLHAIIEQAKILIDAKS